MKAPQNKSNVELLVTELDVKQCEKEKSTKVMAKSLTTWDIIGLAVLITFPLGLFPDMRTVFDSRKEVDK